jgi:hypothetical protein
VRAFIKSGEDAVAPRNSLSDYASDSFIFEGISV